MISCSSGLALENQRMRQEILQRHLGIRGSDDLYRICVTAHDVGMNENGSVCVRYCDG